MASPEFGGQDPTNAEAFIIRDDEEALQIIDTFTVQAEAGVYHSANATARSNATLLLDLAKRVGSTHSFADNQTYPRPSHPYAHLRKSPYFTLASILVSLRCTLKTEMQVSSQLIAAAPSDEALLAMRTSEMAEIVRPSGFADRKAQWIVDGLRELSSNEALSVNVLSEEPLEIARAKVMALPGFGPKATDCFLLAGLNRPSFPVDVNVFNLIAKNFPDVTGSTKPSFTNPRQVSAVKNFLEATIPKDVKLYQIMHTYLLLATKHRIE